MTYPTEHRYMINSGRRISRAFLIAFASFGVWSGLMPLKAEVRSLDISSEADRRVIIEAGTEETYQGHPTTVLLADGKTMFAVWTLNHGGQCGPMKRSDDGGLSWSPLLKVPENWTSVRNCPTIYRLSDNEGKERLFVFAGQGPGGSRQPDNGQMHQAMSEDGGKTWSSMKGNGLICVMPFCTIIPVDGGKRLIGLSNIRRPGEIKDRYSNILAQSESVDGGLTWSQWRVILDLDPLRVCEPEVIRSPDGKQLLCLYRENLKRQTGFMTSDDEGRTWSSPKLLPQTLVGDRHKARYVADGRLVICFRDKSRDFGTMNHFVCWIGRYDEIPLKGGGKRVKLLHSHAGADCGYPGVELLPDDTVVATTYIKLEPGKKKHSVVSVRFNVNEFDGR